MSDETVPDEIGGVTKEWFLDFWNKTPGTPEAEEFWRDKVAMMQGKRLRSTPMVMIPRDVAYTSPIDGRPIMSMAQRKDDLARNNCIEYDPGMKQDHERRQKESDASLDANVERHVEESFLKMPSAKKERLANELMAGATAETVRLTANGG